MKFSLQPGFVWSLRSLSVQSLPVPWIRSCTLRLEAMLLRVSESADLFDHAKFSAPPLPVRLGLGLFRPDRVSDYVEGGVVWFEDRRRLLG
jgi:hypothetical protein